MSQAIIDFYRCPGDQVNFELLGMLSQDPGYFSFGPEVICYGKSSSGFRSARADTVLYDVLPKVTFDGNTVRVPMDPNEVVENLRYERYRSIAGQHNHRFDDHAILRSLYYHCLRPFLAVPLRKHLQKFRVRGWETVPFPQWPLDRTVERILERLLVLSMKAQGIPSLAFIWFWPDAATSCVIMTHDVEHKAGRNFCSQLMDLDDGVGIKSSFQIVPEARYPVPDAFLRDIRDRGFEINIHDLNHDGLLFSSRETFLRRAARINAYGRKFGARGFRAGGLYRNQDWYDALDFSYDMSVPSVAHLEAQRGGCCSLMPFFIDGILELPVTTTQDYSMFHIIKDYSIELWRKQLDAIRKSHGLASFIVHPDYIIERRARATYQALLDYLAWTREEHGAWIALPGEVDRWWRERSQMHLVRDGNGWRIEGNGKERARLAFATLVNDELTLSVEDRK